MSSLLVLVANSADGTITSFDYTDGRLTALAVSAVGAQGLPLAVDAGRGLVYAGTRTPAVVTLRLDRDTGVLTPQHQTPIEGAPTYLTLSGDGTRLLAASYGAGIGQCWRVADGVLTPAGTPVRHRNLHCVRLSADDAHAYFVSLGEDLVAQFALGPDGVLTGLEPATVPGPRGAGLRHLILDAAQTSAYLITEYSGEVLHFHRDPATGTLTPVGSVVAHPGDRGLAHSRMGADPRADHLIWGSDLHLSTSGRVLYCAERTAGTITAVPVTADGSLGTTSVHSDVVPQPRAFAVLPDGQVLVASETTGQLGLYRSDERGALTFVSSHPVGPRANWISVLARDVP